LAKFNVTLDCFYGWPIGTLVHSMLGNSDVRATGKVLGGVRKNSDVIPSKVPLYGVSGPHIHVIQSIVGQPESTSQTVSRSVQPFLQCSRSLQTDRQTDRPRCINGPYSYCYDEA